MAILEKEMILKQILRWIEQTGLNVTKVEDPQADFHFILSEPNLPQVEIIHTKPESDFVMFAAHVVPPEDIQKKMMELDSKRRIRLISEIRLKLLSGSLEFSISGSETQIPNAYEIYSKFFLEGNTVQSFWQTYVLLKSACVMIISLYRESLEDSSLHS